MRMEHATAAELPSSGSTGEFIRPSPVDLPSLAESVRSVEARIARQNAEYEALSVLYERARDAERGCHAPAHGADLAAARAAWREQSARDFEKDLDRASARSSAFETEQARGSERDHLKGRWPSALAPSMPRWFKCCIRSSERDAQLAALQQNTPRSCRPLKPAKESSTQLEEI